MGMNRLVKVYLVSLVILSSGCASTTGFTGGDVVKGNKVESIPNAYKPTQRNYNNLDDILDGVDDLEKDIFYQKKMGIILRELENKEFYKVQSMVKDYGKELEKRGDWETLSNLKEFSYFRYDSVSDKYQVEQKPSKNLLRYLGAGIVGAGGAIFLLPLTPISGLAGGDTPKSFIKEDLIPSVKESLKFKEEQTLISPGYYIKVLVNPYYGTEKVVDDYVPLNEVK